MAEHLAFPASNVWRGAHGCGPEDDMGALAPRAKQIRENRPMAAVNETEQRIRTYFRAKTAQMKALAELAVCEHAGLIGSHREQLHRIYLQEILPKRFSVGRGMIYGFAHRSREVDVVIWDELNYMTLPLLDHSFFFCRVGAFGPRVQELVEC